MTHGQLATLTQWTTGNAFLQHALLTLNSNTIPSIPLPEVILGPQKEVFWPTKFFVCSSGTNSSRCCVLGRHILQRPRHLAASNQQKNMAGRHGELVVFTRIRPVMLLLWLVWWWFLYWKEVCCFSHCLVLVDWNGYSPENQHGTWKWTPGKGESFWKPYFSGSMLVFGVGDLLWVVFFTGKMKHQFSWAQLFVGMLSCRVCQNKGSQWVKSTRKIYPFFII